MNSFAVNLQQLHNTMSSALLVLFGNGMLAPLVVCLIMFLAVTYWVFYVPYNWKRHIDDVGYKSSLVLGSGMRRKYKKCSINQLRRLRKTGLRELPPPYPNGWYSIIESSELNIGEAKSVLALGQQFVVFRALSDKVYVLDAYCPHMGANLGIGGQVIGEDIVCPFHQWRFRGSDGICNNVPYSNYASAAKVKKWISQEKMGNVFVWFHAETDRIPYDLPCGKEIENNYFVFHGRNEFYVNCHIQDIPENGADFAHFSAIHSENFLAGGSDPRKSAIAHIGRHHWKPSWSLPKDGKRHIASLSLSHFLQLYGTFKLFHMDVKANQIGPSIVQMRMKSKIFGEFEVLQTVTPIEPLVQKVVHRFYAPRVLAPFMKVLIFGESVMFERDVTIWNHKTYYSQPQLVKEDSNIKSFRNWYKQFYTENSLPFMEARESLNW